MSLTEHSTSIKMLYFCVYFVIGSVIFTLSILTWLEEDQSLLSFDLIIENWKQNPINQIQVVPIDSDCPEGYDKISNHYWSGTKEGCNCLNMNDRQVINKRVRSRPSSSSSKPAIERKLYDFACEERYRDKGCVDVPATDAKNMSNWHNTENSQTFSICGRKINYDFIEAPIFCMGTTKSCDSANEYLYCIDKNEECPITNLEFGSTNSDDNQINLNDNLSLFFSRNNPQGLPLVEFKVSEEGVCLNNRVTRVKDFGYILMRQEQLVCEIDQRFQLLNQIPETTFFELNNLIETIDTLPQYPPLTDDTFWGLYSRSYIPWQLECRGDFQKTFIQEKEEFPPIQKSKLAIFIFSCIFVGIHCVILPMLQFKFICCPNTYGEDPDDLFLFQIIVKTFILLPQFITLIVVIAFINVVLDILSTAATCSDPITNALMLDLTGNLENNKDYYIGMIVSLILFYIIDVIYFFEAIKKTIQELRDRSAKVEPDYDIVRNYWYLYFFMLKANNNSNEPNQDNKSNIKQDDHEGQNLQNDNQEGQSPDKGQSPDQQEGQLPENQEDVKPDQSQNQQSQVQEYDGLSL